MQKSPTLERLVPLRPVRKHDLKNNQQTTSSKNKLSLPSDTHPKMPCHGKVKPPTNQHDPTANNPISSPTKKIRAKISHDVYPPTRATDVPSFPFLCPPDDGGGSVPSHVAEPSAPEISANEFESPADASAALWCSFFPEQSLSLSRVKNINQSLHKKMVSAPEISTEDVET